MKSQLQKICGESFSWSLCGSIAKEPAIMENKSTRGLRNRSHIFYCLLMPYGLICLTLAVLGEFWFGKCVG